MCRRESEQRLECRGGIQLLSDDHEFMGDIKIAFGDNRIELVSRICNLIGLAKRGGPRLRGPSYGARR